MTRQVPFLFGCVLSMCLLSCAFADGDTREAELANGVVQRIYPDGRRTIVVGGQELADRTPAPQSPPEASGLGHDELERGFVLYRRASSDQVFRRSAPKPDERVTTLATAVSPCEKRHVQFAVYALKDLGQIEVSAGPLADPQGQALSVDAMVIRPVRVGFWRNYWDPWFQEAPKLIDSPDSTAEASQGESQQFWVTVNVPESTPPGKYQGKLTIGTAKGGVAELTLNVQVLPFKLADGIWWGIYYYPTFNANTPRDFADMKAHGVNGMLICPPGNREPVLERKDDKLVASFPATDKAMAELQRQGFRGPIAYYPRMLSCRILRMFGRIDGDKIKDFRYYGQLSASYRAEDFPDDLKPVLADVFQQMVRHAKEANWPEILWYLVDEPGAAAGHENELEWAKLEYPLFRQACPDQRTLCTAYAQKVIDQIGAVDVRVCDLWRIDEHYVASARKQNAEVWPIRWLCQYNTYLFPRQFAGLALAKRGVTGFTEWTYYGAPVYDPYEQLRSKHGCHYAYVNDRGELLTTLTWEAVQEGIDDGRYVATLRKLMDTAATSDEAAIRDLGESAGEALEAILADVPAGTGLASEDVIDQLRARLADQIVRLNNALAD